jgi:hypothetical protein
MADHFPKVRVYKKDSRLLQWAITQTLFFTTCMHTDSIERSPEDLG